MKKFLAIAACFLMTATASFAQSKSTPAIDTVGTSDTSLLLQPNATYFNGGDGTFSIGFTATKISGTASATVILETSIDGVGYKALYGNSLDSFAVTNIATPQVKNWYVTGVKPLKVRVKVITPAGTQSTQVKAFFIKQ